MAQLNEVYLDGLVWPSTGGLSLCRLHDGRRQQLLEVVAGAGVFNRFIDLMKERCRRSCCQALWLLPRCLISDCMLGAVERSMVVGDLQRHGRVS